MDVLTSCKQYDLISLTILTPLISLFWDMRILLLSSTFSDGRIKLADTDRVVENINGKLDFSFDNHTIQNASIKLYKMLYRRKGFNIKFNNNRDFGIG